jgi:hypothetical protein
MIFVSLGLLFSSCGDEIERQFDFKIKPSSNTPKKDSIETMTKSQTMRLDSIEMGDQTWSVNINLKTFANGDKIKCAKNIEEWIQANINKEPVWAYYEFDSINEKKYGLLYNYFVISDERMLYSENWRVPKNKDWIELEEYISTNYSNFDESNEFTTQLGGCIRLDWRTLDKIKEERYQISENTQIFFDELNVGGFWWSDNVLHLGQENIRGEEVMLKSGITFFCKNWNNNISESDSPIFEGNSIRLIKNK